MKRSKIKEYYNKFKEDPKKTILFFFSSLKKYYSNNMFFIYYIFVNVTNGLMLRYLTLGSLSSFFAIQPFLADLAFVVLIGSISYLFKERGRTVYLFILTFIFTLLCVINSIYYTFYTSFASISLLSTSKFISEVGDAVVDNVIQIKDFFYLILPISMIAVYRKLNKAKYFLKASRKKKLPEMAVSTSVTGALILILFIITLKPVDLSRFAKQWNREYIVDRFGLYIYHVNDLVKSVEPKITALIGYDEQYQKFTEYFVEEKEIKKNEYTGIYEGKNIITIHGESIQNFVIGLKINGKEVTPNLNKLANSSLYFNNFYTQVSVGTSSDTEFTLNTSLMPSNTGTAFVSFFNREYITIPKLLSEKNYYNLSFHANSADYWNRRVMYQNLGYDKFYAKDSYEIDETIGLGLTDGSFLRQTVPLLKKELEEHKNIYATVILLTNHTPFYDVSEYSEFDVSLVETVLENDELVDKVYPYMTDTKLGRYLQSVHYVDQELGKFFNALEEEGILDDTVLVFYGDHDARLPRKEYERLYNYDKENNKTLDKDDENYVPFDSYQYELNRQVPLIIYSKDSKYKGQFDYPMGMIDVSPTLGNMFGFYNKYALGNDIFDIKENNTVYFPNGNWLSSLLYYNSKKEEQYIIKEAIIDDNYIAEKNKESEEILSVSNSILLYDLLNTIDQDKKDIDEGQVITGVK